MRAYHNSRDLIYRAPFGAAKRSEAVYLAIDVFDDENASCKLRTWQDGIGERLFDMDRTEIDGGLRFTVSYTPDTTGLVWYSFNVTEGNGHTQKYGAHLGSTGGDGDLWYEFDPPSFQMTVYDERRVPDWYKNGVVYQIFPDRFKRDENWRDRAEKAIREHNKNGTPRAIVDNWDEKPCYKRYHNGAIERWDFYGGSLKGIEEKLDYIAEMGFTVLYLNPIFEAHSNHRYDTADYRKIDPMLGTDEDFEHLCAEAEKRGISIILDGVFNHTGCDSIYFNRYGNYDSVGAYQSASSPYRSWYRFYENGYESWWGVEDLPACEENDRGYQDFIYGDEDSIVRHWLRKGAKGWRLDVADELPDFFIEGIKSAAVAEKGDEALVIGEVWEDASNKIAYGEKRNYLMGKELDSVMNYPFRDCVKYFFLGKMTAQEVAEKLWTLYENYPREAFYSTLNSLGTHDRARILTVLGDADPNLPDNMQFEFRLSDEKRNLAKARLLVATVMQMTMPGVPCVYYGDDAGLEGYTDPYNRGTMPWDDIDETCNEIVRNCIALRKSVPALVDGDFEPFALSDDILGFKRTKGDETIVALFNRQQGRNTDIEIPAYGERVHELMRGRRAEIKDGKVKFNLWGTSAAVFYFTPKKMLAEPMPEGRGVLCHITSLPNADGAGTIGKEAFEFIDFLKAHDQKYWQILPLNPPDEWGSPYAGASAFAGNEALIGLSDAEMAARFVTFVPDDEYDAFCRENAYWLDGYGMYCALSERYDHKAWQDWPKKYRRYDHAFYNDEKLRRRSDFFRYRQYIFDRMWREVRAYAKKNGVMIIGDIPMYVAAGSADVWTAPEMFSLDENYHPFWEAGVPPDIFSMEGQLWGNPTYNWEKIRETDYDWWIKRMKRAFALYDYVRLDHFRGFEQYWAVPHGKSAKFGHWVYGPGMELFEKAEKALGPLKIMAEDLGFITPAVNSMLARIGVMGTEVIQFYDGNVLKPYDYRSDKIIYPGTHDSCTLKGWVVLNLSKHDPEKTSLRILDMIYSSEAPVIITPLQDLFGLDDEARMNTPGTTGKNWSWQAKKSDFTKYAQRIDRILKIKKGDKIDE